MRCPGGISFVEKKKLGMGLVYCFTVCHFSLDVMFHRETNCKATFDIWNAF